MENKINLIEQAGYLHALVNRRFYEFLLAAFQNRANYLGFEFVEGRTLPNLPSNTIKELGIAVLEARLKFMSPFESMDNAAAMVIDYEKSGDGHSWVQSILLALQERGVEMRIAHNYAEPMSDPESFEFELVYALHEDDRDMDSIIDRLVVNGCTDATIGIGNKARLAIYFNRIADTRESAERSAKESVATAIPTATLIDNQFHAFMRSNK